MANKQIESKLASREIKPTAMRVLVLQFLMKQKFATSLQQIENAMPSADKSTIYRTLKTFEKNRLIHAVDDGTKQVKYALCLESCQCNAQDQHYHFHCTYCQNTYCLTNQHVPQIDLPINFKMLQANLVIKGLCGNCNME